MASEKWSAEFLEEMRRTGDDLADKTIGIMFKDGDERVVSNYLSALGGNQQTPKDNLGLSERTREAIDDFLMLSSILPDWKDEAKLAKAAELFENNGMIAFTLLGCASLPELYTCGRGGTQVLGTTLQLEGRRMHRRIYETSRFVTDVMSKDGLSESGPGLNAAQRVRLMHAAIRFLIKRQKVRDDSASDYGSKKYGAVLLEKEWNEDWGVPIGQDYLGVTLMTFSYVVIKGLENLGIEVSQDEAEAYIHRWNVVGHVMGINEKFLLGVKTMADAKELFDAVMSRSRSRTPEEARDGIELTRALIKFMAGLLKARVFLGRFLPFRHIPRWLIKVCTSEETCKILRVKLSILDWLAVIPVSWFFFIFGKLLGRFGKPDSIAEFLFRGMAHEMWSTHLFEIPQRLAKAWRLQNPSYKGKL